MNCFRFDNVINNTMIINSDNSNTACIKTQNRQIMTAIANIMLKFQPILKKTIMTNHTFFAVVTFRKISYFAYTNSIVIQH